MDVPTCSKNAIVEAHNSALLIVLNTSTSANKVPWVVLHVPFWLSNPSFTTGQSEAASFSRDVFQGTINSNVSAEAFYFSVHRLWCLRDKMLSSRLPLNPVPTNVGILDQRRVGDFTFISLIHYTSPFLAMIYCGHFSVSCIAGPAIWPVTYYMSYGLVCVHAPLTTKAWRAPHALPMTSWLWIPTLFLTLHSMCETF